MSNVLIRDVPEAELDELKKAAAANNVSLQAYLLDALHAQADYSRRQASLQRAASRLAGRRAVTVRERRAVRAAIDEAHAERARRLSER